MNCKYLKSSLTAIVLVLGVLLGVSTTAWAQQPGKRTITGTVVDETNQPLPGVTIIVEGTTTGTITDFDGNYSIVLTEEAENLQFSYIGYQSQTVPVPQANQLNVQLLADTQEISDVVVVGYGVQRKSDLTGSITSVGTDDFNSGLISSPEQLINGKVSGVQIMQNSGSPTSGSTIRIRGGASLNASNDPLIVLDGVPLESGGISGNSSNFLSLINPNDIENMTILKDAASTAIYGSRASNGVILITTKKGSTTKGIQVNFSTTNSVQTKTQMPDMLSRSQYVDVMTSRGSDEQKALIGDYSTDWYDQIYQAAFGTDNNLSLSTRVAKNTPMRVSLGYYNQDGILKSDNAERLTGSVSVSPSFLDDNLKFNLSAKGAHNNNTFAQTSAIWAASIFNPTLPVYSGTDAFGGYDEAIDNGGNPVNGGVRNPLGLIEQYNSTSKVDRVIGNIDMDYKFSFLPELKFHATAGYDYAKGKGNIYVPAEAAQYYTTGGRDYAYGPQKNTNRLLTTYFNYNKYYDALKSSVEATLGYDYQYWKSTTPLYQELNTAGEVQSTSAATDQRHAMVSYYGRLNYGYDGRFMVTASLRRDGTSRFSDDNRWGTFPSVALAWRMDQESFLMDNPVLSTLKLRLSYGITGQQEGIGNYNYLPVYTYSQEGAEVQYGDQWYYTYRPEAYVSDLKWETTKSWNAGFDFGFMDNRISGTFDFYTRQTEDLLATVPAAAGTNFDKNILTNVGNVDSHGIEITLNASPIQSKNLNWDVSFNMSWQKMEVKNLSLIEGGSTTNTLVGPSIDSYQFQVLSEGYEPYMFYLYHQLYDAETGKPIEGAYADLNNDGQINSSDLYRYHSPAPDFILGFSSSLNYKKWTMNMSFRANIGNYVYNGMAMNTGAWSTVSYNSYQLNNLSTSFLETGFNSRQYLSDYYVENASFLKMDNLTLTYNFGKIWDTCNLNINGMVQNVFTITNYSGVDPEVPNGMDMNFYPRPRTFSLGLGLNF
ncbi:TonB-dependent receptor [Mangrovibacterium marinum]|uniref:Iron complex outermembrane receptor protein n=1 Tax=Mangrovibacterium marinum TaxID=1639118 RepID=A0A2T5C6T9_9BACT|nr:TonB-dependent receptor [Mangrovibacterium marinum]PTN10622.1 iron complex outermembrane receptor protein [Mangrovibacterium marinum]